jgi:hypothetical protein
VPLDPKEVVPGAVAILDAAALVKDKRVETDREGRGTFRPGPFVCVQTKEDRCLWVAITSQADKRGLRLELRKEWRLEGSHVWKNGHQYVNDARKPFIGPIAAFVDAGSNELPHRPHKRPQISAQGVAAMEAELKKYGAASL